MKGAGDLWGSMILKHRGEPHEQKAAIGVPMASIFGLPELFATIAIIVWVEIDRRIDKRSREIREDIADLRREFKNASFDAKPAP